MPFCHQCGNQVAERDVFCARCGTRQPAAPSRGDGSLGLSPKAASILCYIPGLGWIMSVVVLASNSFRNDRTVRFHAFQGLYLFVAYLVASVVLKPMEYMAMPLHHIFFSGIIEVALFVASIYMIVKVSQGYMDCALPIFGELAHRSADER